ncbi:MAG: aminodeoxychorismate synthase component I [Bacteroidota bacterium]
MSSLLHALRSPGTVLLDAPRPDADTGRRGALLFASPREILRTDRLGEVPALLDRLDAALGVGHHVAGALSYEAGYALEPDRFVGADPDPTLPVGWFGVYDAPEAVSAEALDAALAGLPMPRLGEVQFALDAAAYAERIDAVRCHIREGDVYQINLTAPFRFRLDGDALGLFAALRARQEVAYGAFLRLGEAAVASVSPELFFRVDAAEAGAPEAGRTITARPMKGTAPRGGTAAADQRLGEALQASPKDRAENLMIVDLLRNDLARVAEAGSVRVPALFEAERYATVTQMTSTIQADLLPDATLGDAMRALFPCGSVTGAPKLRAMEIIRGLEVAPRGVYCGAIGYAAPAASGLAASGWTGAFNVAIRTAVVSGGEGRYDVGSGIVWDSEAEAEYAECLLKARVLTDLAS